MPQDSKHVDWISVPSNSGDYGWAGYNLPELTNQWDCHRWLECEINDSFKVKCLWQWLEADDWTLGRRDLLHLGTHTRLRKFEVYCIAFEENFLCGGWWPKAKVDHQCLPPSNTHIYIYDFKIYYIFYSLLLIYSIWCWKLSNKLSLF